MSWWREGVLYQIYPRSFQDSNGDGIGDLEGIRRRLDHLRWLGVDGIWLSPITPSPQDDFGYDVADYTDVDPIFGDLDDFDRLVADAHARGLRVVLDLVPNHTSDRHRWFEASRGSRTSDKRHWYVWADPAPDGGPPNNWLSVFGGPAWTLDEGTGQYYLHSFLPSQPDLNWWNPEVRDAIDGAMRFWLDRGVDGFRIDVVYRLVKDRDLRSNPWLPDVDRSLGEKAQDRRYSLYRPEVHDVCRRFRRLLDAYDDRMAVGEVTLLDPEKVAAFYGDGTDQLHLAFDFHFCYRPWDADDYAREIDALEAALPAGAQPCRALSNHDVPRHARRYGPERARAAAVLLLGIRSTPFLYQGEEIGMTGCDVSPQRRLDVVGRDVSRTPMQWSEAPHAGFTDPGAEPWLPICRDHVDVNVAAQADDPSSLLHLYRDLLRLRRETPALHRGAYRRLDAPGGVLLFERSLGRSKARIAVNFTDRERTVPMEGWVLALATHAGVGGNVLPPNAACVLIR